jgi:hypothetical protein
MVAIFVLAVAVTGVMGSFGSGMTVVGHGRQRSSASAVAKEKIERLYNTTYEGLALNEEPIYAADPTSPDHNVEGSSYRIDAATLEPLVTDTPVDATPGFGAIPHYEDPVTLGKTDFNIYQYVTWVDDPQLTDAVNEPDHDYKRAVVVVTWKNPVQAAGSNRVTETTFVSDGKVDVPPPPTPSPTAPPTPTPPPFPPADPSACPGDESGPTTSTAGAPMEILSGTGAESGFTSSTLVEVRVTATDACTDPKMVAALSNDGTNFTEVTELLNDTPTTVGWTVPAGSGSRTITVRFRDAKGNLSESSFGSIILDQVKPTPGPTLTTASCDVSGNPKIRVATLGWTQATDENFVGYRVMRSVGGGAYSQLLLTTAQSLTDTNNGEVEVKFQVIAFDKAGNSEASNEVVYRQKNCN